MTPEMAEAIPETRTDSPVFDTPPDERPAHRAVCVECSLGVTFRSTASGAGFTVLQHTSSDPELTFGISAAGLPLCPNSHGEMAIADEQLSVAEALEQVAEQLAEGEAVQRSLPGIIPAFNFQGAYTEIEAKAVEVEALTRVEEEDHDTYKESKKAREKAADVLTKMILEFRRRRREKAEGGEAGSSSAPSADTRCRFEQLNPGVPCPICTDDEQREKSTVNPASEEHGVEAKDLLVRREIEATVEQLEAIGIIVAHEVLGALPMDELAEVQAWALDATQSPDERERWMAGGLPRGLGTPHVAAEGLTPDPDKTFEQHCAICGARIDDGGSTVFSTGARVGTDCPGAEREPARQLPRRKKAKKK